MWDDRGIYAPGPIKPVVDINENLAIWSEKRWKYGRAVFIEGMPYSSPMIVDVVAQAGATVLAAGANTTKQLAPIIQINQGEMLHLRFKPLENVEGQLFETAADGRWTSRAVTARITKESGIHDPYWAASTFWIYGFNRDINIQVFNRMGYAVPQARFAFWGYRYVVEEITPNFERLGGDRAAIGQAQKDLNRGDPVAIKAFIGHVTMIPAEGHSV